MKVILGKYPGPRSKKERKISVRIDPWDTWNADHTLALIIEPMLIQLKATTHGFPTTMYDLVGVPVDEQWKATEEQTNSAIAKWEEILDAMIWSFHELNDDEDALSRLHKKHGEEWLTYVREYEEKVQYGISLFGQYFQALWD